MKNPKIPKQIYEAQHQIIRTLERQNGVSLTNSEKSIIRQFLFQIKSGRGKHYKFRDTDFVDVIAMFSLQYIDHCDLTSREGFNSVWPEHFKRSHRYEGWKEYFRRSREIYLLP